MSVNPEGAEKTPAEAASSRTSRARLGTRTQVSSSALNTPGQACEARRGAFSAAATPAGGGAFKARGAGGGAMRPRGGVGVKKAGALGVGDHARGGEFGLAPLPLAVLRGVMEPYLAVAAGLV